MSGIQDGPVMDGANDDMSDGGTPKTEVQDLIEAGRVDEATPPGLTDQGDSLADDADAAASGDHESHAPEAVRDPAGLATDGLQENPLG